MKALEKYIVLSSEVSTQHPHVLFFELFAGFCLTLVSKACCMSVLQDAGMFWRILEALQEAVWD